MTIPRELPAPDDGGRVETGPIQFGIDWPGLFIRGDNCANYVPALIWGLEKIRAGVDRNDFSALLKLAILDGLLSDMRSPENAHLSGEDS